MNCAGLEPTFAVALRAELVDQVTSSSRAPRTTSRPIPRRRRWFLGAGSVAVLAAAAGTAYALGATSPGGTEVTNLTPVQTRRYTGTATVELGARPAGATAVEIEFTCLSAGTFRFPNGSSSSCDGKDLRRPAGAPAMLGDRYELAQGQHSLTITADDGASWTLSTRYVSTRLTDWGVNAKGETFGVQNERGEPDLLAVYATNGRQGYVYTRELNAAGGSPPTDPADAQARNQALARGIPVTVYQSDGETVVGQFVIGGGDLTDGARATP